MKANELSVNELMIGDWMYSTFSESPCKVTYIKLHESGYGSVETTNVEGVKDISSLAPIPITQEILEKNGFSDDYCDDDLSYAQSCGNIIGIHINGKNGLMDEMYFKYVHQLQQALRLCGIDKTIEL